MISDRTGRVYNLFAAFAMVRPLVGALPDLHDRGNPVKPGPFIKLFERQPLEARKEVRRAIKDDGWVITQETAATGWLLHLWEPAGPGRAQVRSTLLPLIPRPAAAEPSGAPPQRPSRRCWSVVLALALGAATGFVGGVAAQQHGLNIRSPFTFASR